MLAHALALRLGRTVRELMASMDSREWTSWIAYDHLCPIGDDRADVLAGTVAAAVASQWRGKDADPLTPADMVPDWGERRARLAEMRRERQGGPKLDREAWQGLAEDEADGPGREYEGL